MLVCTQPDTDGRQYTARVVGQDQRLHIHTGTQAHRHTGTQAHRLTGTQAHRHTFARTCTYATYAQAYMYMYTGSKVYKVYTGISHTHTH